MENKTLFDIAPSDIAPNPHNPRLIFDREELDELKNSISKVGIMVPLTVYLNPKDKPEADYILLDGERRWRCATELNLTTVPANVIDKPKDVTQNILYMFNIHHFRKEWALFPTALKLEIIVKKLETDSESILSSFTGVSRSMIRRCKRLLWYPKKYRTLLMDKNSQVSTDFFIELYPIAQRLSQEPEFNYADKLMNFIDSMINIFENNNTITDVKEFREIRKAMAFYTNRNDINSFKDKINEFIESPERNLQLFSTQELETEKKEKNILKYASLLKTSLEDMDPNLFNDLVMLDQLKSLMSILEKIIEEIE